jgi:hypothetical protein
MDDQGTMGLSSLAEINYLRLEAMELFERCLAEGRSSLLESFIEQQISREPPLLELLREIAEDLHQRLLSLREYRADLLERVLRTLSDDFGLAVSAFTMGDALIEIERRIANLEVENLSADSIALLHKMLDTSLETAAQLREDIAMTERLHLYIVDWFNGLNALAARRRWVDGRSDQSGGVQ